MVHKHIFARVENYEDAREHQIKIWSPIIWRELIRVPRENGTISTENIQSWIDYAHFKVITNHCLWYVTSISEYYKWKYLSQRYFSQRALEFIDSMSGSSSELNKSMPNLRHEHVFTRKSLIKEIANAKNECSIREILTNKAIGCVVTKDEDNILRESKNLEGWDRYKNGRSVIKVYDRKTNRWII